MGAAAKLSTKESNLDSYFRLMGSSKLLDAHEELELGRRLARAEIDTWHALMSHKQLRKLVTDKLRGDEAWTRALGICAKTGTPAGRTLLRAAERLRNLDLDREVIDPLLRSLETLVPSTARPVWDRARTAAQEATSIRETFVTSNLRLVVTMARRYDKGALPLPDLIQEGNLGLMHSVGRFDPARGLRFSTYACWWIRHAIGRAIANKGRAIRIPVHTLEVQAQLEQVRRDETRRLGRPPRLEELAKAAKISVQKLSELHQVRATQPISLDRPTVEDDERSLGDAVPDPASEYSSPALVMHNNALATDVTRFLTYLSPVEADIVKKRFGLAANDEATFREIGLEYKLSRERVRQIQNAALLKLRRAMEREHHVGVAL